MKLSSRSLRPAELHAMTGLSPTQMLALLEQVHEELRPARGRPWHLALPDRLLLTLAALRTNLTERQLGVLFGIPQAQVDRIIRHLTPILARLLRPPPRDRRELWVVAGTLIPVHSPRAADRCKNYRRSVNVQILCRARDLRVCAVGTAWPGNRNDSVVFRETLGQDPAVAAHPRLIGDGAYRGVEGVSSPVRGPDGRIVRNLAYRRFRRRRARVEHVIGRLKVWQVLRQIRRKGSGVDEIVRAVAALHNLRLEVAA